MRTRIDDNGCLEIVDPDFSDLPLLRALDPDFAIHTAPLPGFTTPRFLACRHMPTSLDKEALASLPETLLWEAHDETVTHLSTPAGTCVPTACASLLDLKRELAHRLLGNCRLCARRCGVDRSAGERGFCGLGGEALLAKWAPHIAEEPPINPSLLVSVYGCALRCRYCQQGALQDAPTPSEARPLDAALWQELDLTGVRSLSFIGGNPDESLQGILQWLSHAPEHWPLPIVWNCHAYESPETLRLLKGIVDCYVPDFRYGNEACAIALSEAPGYPDIAVRAIQTMLYQHVPVIVRILALPGHLACCHMPALQQLARINAPNLTVSIRSQYCPDWRIAAEDGVMAGRVSREQMELLIALAQRLKIAIIDAHR